MLTECKNDREKTAMGLLSYLPDFKNLTNLKDEIKLNRESPEFQLYLYSNEKGNCVGVIGTQDNDRFIVIRYISMAPGYRNDAAKAAAVRELASDYPKKKVTAVPEYTYLLRFIKKDEY
ncbi:reductase [Lactobacillus sp. ESL0791]|uniref:reductase n=1 Tax=Lactobacillus sp. ESL0791 TaxID=2983234 RepID=UPI0023F6F542|nr:reductase [Lactobacillus sp. ESL0791]MDF7638867.1 reductase [Lactobacillus sp. ESL0791]